LSGKVEKKTAKDRQSTTPQKGIDRISQQANSGRPRTKSVYNLCSPLTQTGPQPRRKQIWISSTKARSLGVFWTT
jgi:hypothetical protein